MNNLNSNEAWIKIIEKYDIINQIKNHGYFRILSKQIKEFKEPRLMSKWDSSESLPSIFKKHNINILPDSRSSYILSDFLLYEKIPDLTEHITEMQKVDILELETIDINNISSEANAINLLNVSNILDDFLNVEKNIHTFNGRMGTGIFDFHVNTQRGKRKVFVKNAQCEIDGGFENEDSIVIMEAKNVIHPDFHIRQLYYPFRLWKNRVKKPIRLVFSIYSNMIFRLFEYEFVEFGNYSSIRLIKEKNYSIQDTEINNDELLMVFQKTCIKTDDNMNKTSIPFIQANSFERVISLLEQLYENSMTEEEIAEMMQFDERQSGYYFNAGRYLGLFEKTLDEYKGSRVVQLTNLGKRVYKLNYKERQLKLVELILEHKIFNIFFNYIYNTGELPDKEEIKMKMREFNVCGESQVHRRSSSVLGWLKWIFNLPKVSN